MSVWNSDVASNAFLLACIGLDQWACLCAPTPNSDREREREIPRQQAWQGAGQGKGSSAMCRCESESRREGCGWERRLARACMHACVCGPSHALLVHSGRSTLGGGGWSRSAVLKITRHMQLIPPPTRYCIATDCLLGAGHGPWLHACRPAGRPASRAMDVDGLVGQRQGGARGAQPGPWSTAWGPCETKNKILSLDACSQLVNWQEREREREWGRCVIMTNAWELLGPLTMMALWRGTNPHASPYAGHHDMAWHGSSARSAHQLSY
jgi:hypothetical protein